MRNLTRVAAGQSTAALRAEWSGRWAVLLAPTTLTGGDARREFPRGTRAEILDVDNYGFGGRCARVRTGAGWVGTVPINQLAVK
jgi:hypothetical protein